jgi:hypothetical protein
MVNDRLLIGLVRLAARVTSMQSGLAAASADVPWRAAQPMIQIFGNFAPMLIQTWRAIPTRFSSAFATQAAGNKTQGDERRRGERDKGQDHVFSFADGILAGRRPGASPDIHRAGKLQTGICTIAGERRRRRLSGGRNRR